MLSSKSSRQLRIIGIEGHNAESIRHEVVHGAKFVVYSYNFSLVVVSFKKTSNVYFIRAGQSRIIRGLPFTLISLLFGWWGIPHGIIFTFQSLATNLGGGRDVTDSVMASIAPATAQAAAAPAGAAAPTPARPSTKPASYALAFVVVAALVMIIYSGVCYYKGQNLPVVLVSGLTKDYDVSLNGQSYHLRPRTPQILALPEGGFDLQARLPGGQAADEHFTFSTDFFSRPFHPCVAVINPDKAAVVYLETTHYYPTGSATGKEENAVTFYVNASTYFLDRPDYVFAEFPATISVPEGTGMTTKTRLDVFRELGPDAVVPLLNKRLGYAAAHTYLQNEARLRPDDETVMGEVVTLLKPADAQALLQSRLSDRPVHIEWHRYYQSLMESLHPDFDLAGQYRRWAGAEPDNGDLTYLYARLIDDPAVSHPLYERALAARHPCAYAAAALGFDEINDTHFQHGLDLLLQAEHAGVHNGTLQMSKRAALLALGRNQDVLKAAEAELAAAPTNVEIFADLLRLQQSTAPDHAAGELSITRFLAQFRRRFGDSAELASLDKYLHASLAYGAGDETGFARLAQQLSGSENAFEAAISRRDPAAAAAALGKTSEAPSRYYWILYLTACSRGDKAAEAYFQKALDALPKEGSRGSDLARLIKSATPADHAEILRTAAYAQDNSVLFTALGLHFPDQRRTYFERARLLDVDPSFPHLLLHSLLAVKPAAGRG